MMPSTTERVFVDGATLAVEQVGAGTSGLVYIPGWCCSRRDFLPVAQEMAGRASLLIDLPGQGESTSERRHWSLAQFGTAIADVVRRRHWDNVVLIGHSLGGAVGIEAAIALGSTALQVICLDALVYESFYAKQTEAFILDTLRPIEEDFAGFMQSLVHALFVDKDSALIDTVARTMAAAPVREALESQRTLLEWDRERSWTPLLWTGSDRRSGSHHWIWAGTSSYGRSHWRPRGRSRNFSVRNGRSGRLSPRLCRRCAQLPCGS